MKKQNGTMTVFDVGIEICSVSRFVFIPWGK